ncbi:MAG: hypothetical protein ABEJ88_09240 [Halobacterium sp.]
MHSFPPIPAVASAPASLLDGGHLWLQEWVAGGRLRVQLRADGLLQFGDESREFPPGDVPVGYQAAARSVRESFDRDALRGAVDDPSSVTFFGVAPRLEPVAYDWERTPSFLGFDVHRAGEGFFPPDAAERTFERLGLPPLNAVAKEVRAADFDPGGYDLPASNWRDGDAAGVLVRNKTGDRALLAGPALDEEPDIFEGDAEAAAAEFATRDRVLDAAAELGDSPGVDAVADRVVETVAREQYARLFGEDASLDPEAFRSATAGRVSRLLADG